MNAKCEQLNVRGYINITYCISLFIIWLLLAKYIDLQQICKFYYYALISLHKNFGIKALKIYFTSYFSFLAFTYAS